jgi:signal transduction histidine kinase
VSAYTASCFAAFAVNLLLGSAVLLHRREAPLNQAFFVGCFALAAWSLAALVLAQPVEAYQAERWARFLAYAVCLMAPVFLQIISQVTGRPGKALVVASMTIALTLSGLNAAGQLVAGVYENRSPDLGAAWRLAPGPFGLALAVFVVGMAAVSVASLTGHAREAQGLARAKARYLALAAALLALAMVHDTASAAMVEVVGASRWLGQPWVPPVSAVWALITAYALLRDRLADLGAALRRSVVRTATLLLLTVPFVYMIVEAEQAYSGSRYLRFSLVTLVMFAIAAFVVPPLRQAAHERLDRLLGARGTKHRRALLDFSKEAARFASPSELIARARFELTSPLGLKTADILIHDGHGDFVPADGWRFAGEPFDIVELADLLAHFRLSRQPAIREEIAAGGAGTVAKRAAAALARAGAEAAFELRSTDSLEGILLLGGRSDDEPLSSEDVDVLSILSNNLAGALRGARLALDLEQSRQVIARSERLSAVGTLAAGLAHEIRNPLVSIRTFTQLLPERLDDPEFRSRFLDLTLSEVDRICALVSELLAFARPAPTTLERMDLVGCVERLCLLLSSQARTRGVHLGMSEPSYDIHVVADEDQLKQVVMNVVLNAIQSCIDGGRVQVSCYRSDAHDGSACIEVVDNGCGIPDDAIGRIFDPFFTTRSEGTGLGLSVAHRIVTSHGGTIDVRSRVGHGSTFVIRLPLDVEPSDALPMPDIAEPLLRSHG